MEDQRASVVDCNTGNTSPKDGDSVIVTKVAREKLDVPNKPSIAQTLICDPPRRPDIQTVPRSAMLDRIKNFLPVMQEANLHLQEQINAGGASAVSLEIPDDEPRSNYIELGLACGVFDLKSEEAVTAAEKAMVAPESVCLKSIESSSEDDADDDALAENSNSTQPLKKQGKTLPKTIEIL